MIPKSGTGFRRDHAQTRSPHERSGGARGRRRRAPQLRQAGRVSVGAHARCRGSRGCAGGCVRGGARGLARERHPAQSRSVAAQRGAAQDDRCGAAAAHRVRRRRSGPPHRAGAGRRRDERERDSRSAPRADVCLRASGDRPRRARAADAADRARLRCRHDRVGVSGRARHHGAAPRTSESENPPGRHSVPRAGARRSRRAARCGAGRDLCGVRRRLVRSGRHADAPPQS